VQIGFNNDVEHGDTRYHVQTEDHGLSDGRITTQVFRGGQILDTITVSYLKAIEGLADEEAREDEIRKRMKALHAHCFRMIKQGKYEDKAAGDVQSGADVTGAVAGPAVVPQVDGAPQPDGAPAESPAGAALLDKPRMPAEPAPAPGLGRVRPLNALRQPGGPGVGVSSTSGDAPADAERSLSDTAEDLALPTQIGLDTLVAEELAGAVDRLVGDDEVEASLASDDDNRDPTNQMAPLADELPEGVVVAGERSELGEDFVASHSRGEVMDLDAAEDSSSLGRSRSPRRAPHRFTPTYSPQRAFRGLDNPAETDLPGLLERLGR
jgi:hypothetical protein